MCQVITLVACFSYPKYPGRFFQISLFARGMPVTGANRKSGVFQQRSSMAAILGRPSQTCQSLHGQHLPSGNRLSNVRQGALSVIRNLSTQPGAATDRLGGVLPRLSGPATQSGEHAQGASGDHRRADLAGNWSATRPPFAGQSHMPYPLKTGHPERVELRWPSAQGPSHPKPRALSR